MWRVILSIGLIVVFGIVIIASTVRVQVSEGDYWRALSDSLTTRTHEIPATRGSIFSEDGNLLATSIPKYKISIDFKVIHDYHRDSFQRYIPVLARRFSEKFNSHSREYYDRIIRTNYKKKSRYVVIERNATYIDLKDIKEWPVFSAGRFKGGLISEERTIRKNPYGGLLARTIGYVNENGVGAGLEATFQDQLAGANGEIVVRRISGGYKPVSDGLIAEPRDGLDIFTTINVEIQDIAHSALVNALERHQAEFGCVIVMEVKTGKIKALVNLSRLQNGQYAETFNYAIGRNIEPGSTMKLLSALALLNDKKIRPQDSVDINFGSYKFYDRLIEDSEKGTHKNLTFRQVFEKSSNVGVARTVHEAYKESPDDFIAYYRRIFEGNDLNLRLKGATKPIWINPTDSLWSRLSLVSTSIGYSVRLSPVNILSLYNAVANNGHLMRPLLVTGYGKMGAIQEEFDPQEVSSSICSQTTLDTLKSLLEGVVNDGTAKWVMRDLPFQVAGKTGTARVPKGRSGYYHDRYNASFVGYFPADEPQYSCYVLVNHPRIGGYYGSSVAAPVFREIAHQIYAQRIRVTVDSMDKIRDQFTLRGNTDDFKQIERHLQLDISYLSRNTKKFEWIELVKTGDTLNAFPLTTIKGTIPDAGGMGLRDALYILENLGYKVKFKGNGKVVEQSPEPGTSAHPGQTIYLNLK